MDQIKYDIESHAELENNISKVEKAFTKVQNALNKLKSSVSSNLDGQAPKALENVLAKKASEISKAGDGWSKVEANAKKVAQGISNADKKVAKMNSKHN